MKAKNDAANCMRWFEVQLRFILGREVSVAFQVLRFDNLICDAPYQRDVQPSAIKRLMAENLSPIAVGFLIVNYRPGDSTAYLVDGNHRVTMLHSKEIEKWPCLVTFGLSLEEEAVLWESFNGKRTAAKLMERLNAQIVAGDLEAIALERLVKSCGFRFPFNEVDENEACKVGHKIVVIDSLAVIQNAKNLGFLKYLLEVLNGAWPGDPGSVHSHIMSALLVFFRSPGAMQLLRKDRLIDILHKKSPQQWMFESRKETSAIFQGPAFAVAQGISAAYNKGLARELKILRLWRKDERAEDVAK